VTQVLARKWRPRNFNELVGQEHVVRALSNALREQRLHHAYLFTGTRGVGKTTLARIIAKALNCENGVTDAPCGKCRACTEIEAGRFVDLIELDAASNTQVENMRELLENALYAPTAGRYKVYIIDEAHMLSRSAFNAMLKTLEEPPEHVKFVLATTDQQKVPVTVLSRCLQFNLKQIPPAQIQEQLAKVLRAEGIDFEAAALALIARAAQGSLRDALSLLDQAISHGGSAVELDSTRVMLGAVDQTYLHSILRALAGDDGAGLIAEADRMAERSLSFEMALQDLGTLLHRLALLQIVPQAVAADDPQAPVLQELAALFSADELQLYYQIAVQGRSEIGLAPDEYAGFTMALLRMLAFAPARDAPSERARPPARPRETGATPMRTASDAVPQTPPQSPVLPENPDAEAWAGIVERFGFTGVARQVAAECEIERWDAEHIELRLSKTQERWLEKGYGERIKAALRKQFGDTLQVTIRVGVPNGNSPAAMAERDRAQQQAQAVAEIEQDPFVRDLVDNFGAHVNEDSIKPIQ